ncbi:hypothetical protein GTY87_20130 [Streptomyces sp. SID7813]|uniref:Uncharacterized protein n=1 Tax=Streptomyces coelicolor (strain ATCC BAA-471 / A3(2) / M145) TaxID=100226 RepID=Q9ZBY9_STRCO|nr:hypothetical protein [Streptomyces sp. SID7813]QFI43939.1 hypothetical protein FQ762_20310 [Streptomyces coelicolor A3(2)]THA94653.1 hypothetical protein E6R61_14555 [Streptomyces sp. LRa12]CAA22214.1 hypothetical protein SCD78.09 [Streptomyces coelicolor A3(2)]
MFRRWSRRVPDVPDVALAALFRRRSALSWFAVLRLFRHAPRTGRVVRTAATRSRVRRPGGRRTRPTRPPATAEG